MATPERRRQPDPDRPGTVYRARPRLTRGRGLSAGPPYLGGTPPDRPVPGGGGVSVGTPSAENPYLASGEQHTPYAGPYAERPGGPYAQPATPYAPERPTGPPPRRPITPPPGRRRARIRWRWLLPLVAVLLIAYPLLLGATAWTHLNRVDAVGPAHAVSDPGDQKGRTYLVVGSDSRNDLTAEERKRLGTGSVTGRRTDTIMMLHVSSGGPTVLVSIPRDSYVTIPGRGKNKINAAYAFGGPSLLIQTVENATGVRIDDYVETGLGGFANIVDAIGGVRLCPDRAMKDKDAHLDIPAGCQQMDGPTALGYARARKSDPRGDLGRVERQREVLAAIAGKTLSAGTIVQPWRAFPAASAGGDALTIDKGTSPLGVVRFVLAMRAVAGGGGLSLTVPIANPALQTSAGEAVSWNRTKALALFRALQNDDTDAIRPLAEEQAKAAG